MFFKLSDMTIFYLCILLILIYAISHHFGPFSEMFIQISQCFGYPPSIRVATATLPPDSAQHPSKRRSCIHTITPHLISAHSRHVYHQHQPPPPYRPSPAVTKSGQPLEAPVSAPTPAIISVKVPMPTRHSIGVPHFDLADIRSLAKYVPREDADFWTSLSEFEAVL